MTELEPLRYETGSKRVGELVHLYQTDQLNLEPGFQRQSVWKLRHRQRLIESIIRQYPLPAIFLYRRDHEGRDIFDVIDGKQRVESLFKFMGVMRERFEVRMPLPGSETVEYVDWSLLRRRHMQNRIEGYYLPVIVVEGELAEIIQLFVRINSTGMALTKAEQSHAKYYNSPFLREAGRLAQKYKPYFIGMGIMSESQMSRMKHVELMCELMLSVHTGDVLNKKAAVDRAMSSDSIDGRSIGKASRGTVAALNRVRRMFPRLGATTRFSKLTDFYTLAVLISRFETEGLVLSDPKRNRLAWDLLTAFSTGVDELTERQRKAQVTGSEHDLHREYLLTVQSGTDQINQRRNRERILRQLLETIFARKDSQRGFTPEQRRIMWNSAGSHRCQGCNTVLNWINFTIDHVDPYTKGGLSDLENAAILCRSCNSSKGARRRSGRQ